MSLKTVTFEAPEEFIATFDAIALSSGETRDYIMSEALASYLSDYDQQKIELEEAERQIDAGNFLTQEQMETRFEAHIARSKAA
jgi:predicted transcriptional regulator